MTVPLLYRASQAFFEVMVTSVTTELGKLRLQINVHFMDGINSRLG